jgi:EF hand
LLQFLGIEVSEEKQEKLFKQYDTDGSGTIDYEEFKKIWVRHANVRKVCVWTVTRFVYVHIAKSHVVGVTTMSNCCVTVTNTTNVQVDAAAPFVDRRTL